MQQLPPPYMLCCSDEFTSRSNSGWDLPRTRTAGQTWFRRFRPHAHKHRFTNEAFIIYRRRVRRSLRESWSLNEAKKWRTFPWRHYSGYLWACLIIHSTGSRCPGFLPMQLVRLPASLQVSDSKPNWTGEKTPEWTSPVLFVCPGISLCCPHVSPLRLAARLTSSNPSTQIRGFNEGNLVSCTGSAPRDSRVCEGLQAEADIMLSDAREAQTWLQISFQSGWGEAVMGSNTAEDLKIKLSIWNLFGHKCFIQHIFVEGTV